MIKKVPRSPFLLLFLFSSTAVLSQIDPDNGYHVEHFTDENGLPQNSINRLLFGSDGYLWLASQVGLIRFDGNSFKSYDPDDKPVMESNVLALGKNDRGNIYFQTSDHNIYRYPSGAGHLLSPVNGPALQKPCVLNENKQVLDLTRFLKGPPGENRQQFVSDIIQHNGHFLAIDPAHFYLYYLDTLYYYDDGRLDKLSSSFFSYGPRSPRWLVQDGRLYILRRDTVMGIYEKGKKVAGQSLIGGDLRKDAAAVREPNNLQVYPGEVTYIRKNDKLYRIDGDGARGLTTRFLLDIGFAKNVSDIAYDVRLDLLGIATETDGFYLLRKMMFRPPDLPQPLREQLSQYLFGPLASYKDTILTANFYFTEGGAFRLFKNEGRQRCLYVDGGGQVWSAHNNTPRKMSRERNVLKVYPALDAMIIDYKEDAKGDLYCLTERSLWRLQEDSFRIVPGRDSLLQKGTYQSLSLQGHRLWIAHLNGLIEYDPDSQRWAGFPGLDHAHIRSIYTCRDGTILLGTYGQGYFYYRRGRFYSMPLDKNRFLITAHCFLEDRKGFIWIPCNKGLFRIPKQDMDAWCDAGGQLYYYYYGRQDGLKTNEFNGGYNPSGLIRNNGFAALLSMKGTVCFHTDSLRADFPEGRIELTNIEIDGQTSPAGDSIRLKPDYNNLLVEISCPALADRDNLHLEYCLQGLSKEWKELPRDGMLNLSRLAPGDYRLRIRKVNGFGRNNYQYRELQIQVIPYFYQTAWFIGLSILAFIFVLVFLVHIWLKLVEKRKEVRVKTEKLEATVISQEETLQKLQESQKALLKSSKMKEKLISLVIHDLRSPIRFLSMLAGDLHDNLANISPEEVKERTYWVKKGTNDIYNFSEDFLLWVTSQKDNFSITRRNVLIRPLLQEIYEFFRDQVHQKGNTLLYESTADLAIYSDPHILITIIRNLVDNANKYTEQGKISIAASAEGENLLIQVSDTGKGMTPQQVDLFLHPENPDNVRGSSQLGHRFVFDLTKRINGTVSLSSEPGRGTTVRLRFPGRDL